MTKLERVSLLGRGKVKDKVKKMSFQSILANRNGVRLRQTIITSIIRTLQ